MFSQRAILLFECHLILTMNMINKFSCNLIGMKDSCSDLQVDCWQFTRPFLLQEKGLVREHLYLEFVKLRNTQQPVITKMSIQ